MEVNAMKNSQNLTSKIKGALYGFAIGDAMGATTEFMEAESIKKHFGQLKDIIGGGWLKLKAGEVTDDTQMTMCVCDAIQKGHKFAKERSKVPKKICIEDVSFEEAFRGSTLTNCCINFVNWYNSNPPDIGNCCRRVISQNLDNACIDLWMKTADDPGSLGNGSLMRTMPIILSGQSEDLARLQGRLTHNNIICDNAIEIYYKNMEELLYHDTFRNSAKELVEPTGHALHTLNNALYWVQRTNSLEESIIKAVNHGGDADTIAAITGSLAGALYGYEAIPQRWIEQLSPDVKKDLDKYAKLFEKINKKVCTNTK